MILHKKSNLMVIIFDCAAKLTFRMAKHTRMVFESGENAVGCEKFKQIRSITASRSVFRLHLSPHTRVRGSPLSVDLRLQNLSPRVRSLVHQGEIALHSGWILLPIRSSQMCFEPHVSVLQFPLRLAEKSYLHFSTNSYNRTRLRALREYLNHCRVRRGIFLSTPASSVSPASPASLRPSTPKSSFWPYARLL